MKNVFVLQVMGPKTTLKNIFFCIPKKKESHTGLERQFKKKKTLEYILSMFSRHIKQLNMCSLFKCILTLRTVCLHKKKYVLQSMNWSWPRCHSCHYCPSRPLCRGHCHLATCHLSAFANYGNFHPDMNSKFFNNDDETAFPFKRKRI